LFHRVVTRQARDARCYKGVVIPAGMAIQANVWALHHDPEYWDNPEQFLPER
jgi:cytochrome P450